MLSSYSVVYNFFHLSIIVRIPIILEDLAEENLLTAL
jgi:hypothetical protein